MAEFGDGAGASGSAGGTIGADARTTRGSSTRPGRSRRQLVNRGFEPRLRASSVEMRCCMDDADSVAASGEFEGLVCAFADAAATTRSAITVLSDLASACGSSLDRMSGCAV